MTCRPEEKIPAASLIYQGRSSHRVSYAGGFTPSLFSQGRGNYFAKRDRTLRSHLSGYRWQRVYKTGHNTKGIYESGRDHIAKERFEAPTEQASEQESLLRLPCFYEGAPLKMRHSRSMPSVMFSGDSFEKASRSVLAPPSSTKKGWPGT